MNKNGNLILTSLMESEREVKEVSSTPDGYIEVKLSTKGKVGAPSVVHVRNFKVSEIISLSLSSNADLPIRLIDILNDMILEDTDVFNWHEKEIEELDNLIKSIEERLGQSHREDQKLEELLNVCKRQQKELEKALGSTDARPYLGMYYYDDDECVITLFVDVIESITIGLDEMMLLMGEVLLHEYFHSFYHHVGVGAKDILRCMEEPMAEYGSLVVLDSVASSNSRIASTAKEALEYSKDFIEKKQSCIGRIAAYGFGAYLYEFHKDDYQSLIANYANVSLLLDKQSNIALEYKYMLYPEYPAPWNEDVAYKKLKALLNVDGVRPSRKDTNMAKRTFQIEHAVTTTSFYSVEAVSREEAESLFMLGKVKKEWEDKNENLDISKMEED